MAPVEPGLHPPPGVTSNFDHPDRTLQILDYITQALSLSIVTPIVIARLYGRLYVTRMFGSEDWVCIVAWTFGVFYSLSTLFLGIKGGGLHQWDITAAGLEDYNRLLYVQVILYGPCAFFTKLSILLLIARIFAPYRSALIFIYTFIGFMALYYLIGIFIKIFICTPIAHFWDPDIPGTCFNQPLLILIDSILSVTGDFIILFLPIGMVWRLQMGIKQKLRAMSVFAVGGIACALSTWRAVMVAKSATNPDQLYSFMRIDLLGNAEVQLGLMCACLPAIPSLVRHFRNKTTSNSSNMKSTTLRLEQFRRATQRASQGYQKTGSDKDILISNDYPYMPTMEPTMETTIEGGEQPSRRTESERIQGGIRKTVQVTQTYPNASSHDGASAQDLR